METPLGAEALALEGLNLTALVLDSSPVLKFGDHREQELRIENDFVLSSATSRMVGRFSPYAFPDIVPAAVTELSTLAGRTVMRGPG